MSTERSQWSWWCVAGAKVKEEAEGGSDDSSQAAGAQATLEPP